MFAMNALTVISTDLLTPLGAYLRLREARSRELPARIGRAGTPRAAIRSSAAARALVDFDEAEACGEPVVGYLGYDHAARLEPTVPLPDDGRGLPESRFVVADTLVRFDHGLGMAEVLCGEPGAVSRPARRAAAVRRRGRASRSARARPGACPRATSTSARSCARRSTSAPATPSRSSSRSAPSGRPRPPRSSSTASLRRVNPSPYLFLLELDGLALIGSSPETLVKAEGRQRVAEPDRRHDPARRGRRGAAARAPRRIAPST